MFDEANLVSCARLGRVAHVHVDDTITATHGYSGVKGLGALVATVSTPIAAPVTAATRLRKGSTNSAKGAARFVADALSTIRRAGTGGLVIVRADCADHNHDVVAAITRIDESA